jgi:hypothetical protein
MCHNMNTKFHKDWLRHSKVNRGVYTDSMVTASAYFFQNQESMLHVVRSARVVKSSGVMVSALLHIGFEFGL